MFHDRKVMNVILRLAGVPQETLNELNDLPLAYLNKMFESELSDERVWNQEQLMRIFFRDIQMHYSDASKKEQSDIVSLFSNGSGNLPSTMPEIVVEQENFKLLGAFIHSHIKAYETPGKLKLFSVDKNHYARLGPLSYTVTDDMASARTTGCVLDIMDLLFDAPSISDVEVISYGEYIPENIRWLKRIYPYLKFRQQVIAGSEEVREHIATRLSTTSKF